MVEHMQSAESIHADYQAVSDLAEWSYFNRQRSCFLSCYSQHIDIDTGISTAYDTYVMPSLHCPEAFSAFS